MGDKMRKSRVETALRMVGFPYELVKLHNYIFFYSDH